MFNQIPKFLCTFQINITINIQIKILFSLLKGRANFPNFPPRLSFYIVNIA